jgi:hypothetical protein
MWHAGPRFNYEGKEAKIFLCSVDLDSASRLKVNLPSFYSLVLMTRDIICQCSYEEFESSKSSKIGSFVVTLDFAPLPES